MTAHEVNFDGIVGPTHNYAGLSFGNVASMRHGKTISNPRQAALEGLAKMKLLMDLGVKQAVLPPQERPHVPTLRRLGFAGGDADALDRAYRENPALLAAACSASSMWAANAATVSPSPDTADGRVHFTPANLIANLHRSIEPPATLRILRAIFADDSQFVVHDSLPASLQLGDEGAANHSRLCSDYASPGVEVFTFGQTALDSSPPRTRRFPVRQTREASAAIARLHELDPSRVVLVRQNPEAIDAGAFHNDVVAVGNLNVMLYHERAYAQPQIAMAAIRGAFQRLGSCELHLIEVPEQTVPLADAISSYLFNSQLVTLTDGSMSLIAPVECRENPRVRDFIDDLLLRGTPINSAHYIEVRQSMHNGGGPACLRLRVVLTDEQVARISGNVPLTDALHGQLRAWIEKHYREQLTPDDLRDPKLLTEGRMALEELTRILNLGPIYEFQQP